MAERTYVWVEANPFFYGFIPGPMIDSIRIKIFDEPTYIQAVANEYGLLGNLVLQAQTLLGLSAAQARHQQALTNAALWQIDYTDPSGIIRIIHQNGVFRRTVEESFLTIPNYEGFTLHREVEGWDWWYPNNPNPFILTMFS